jgi:hypothetical protein
MLLHLNLVGRLVNLGAASVPVWAEQPYVGRSAVSNAHQQHKQKRHISNNGITYIH